MAAEVAAALRISQGLAGSRLRYARAMRERLPKVGEVFAAGDIDYRTFQTIVYRTDLITDDESWPPWMRQLAVNVTRWPSLTQGRLAAAGGQDRGPRRRGCGAPAHASARPTGRSGSGMTRRHLRDPRPPAQPRRPGPGQAVGCVGGHGVCPRSAHPRATPRRCPGRAGRRRAIGWAVAVGAPTARPATGPPPRRW